MQSQDIIFPRPLRRGDKIAILSPAGPVGAQQVQDSKKVLEDLGYRVQIMPHTLGKVNGYSGTAADRLADLRAAQADTSIRAILCSRGGYGVVHLLDSLKDIDWRSDPKWIIGFSDISALHALMHKEGIASVHGSMTSALAKGADQGDNPLTLQILAGQRPGITWDAHPYDHPGTVTGPLVGGNLAVLSDLIGTPYDIFRPGSIIFFEDVSEPVYKIERMLYQMRLAGILDRAAGVVVGQFSDLPGGATYEQMIAMIRDMLAPYDIPVAFDAPVGHVTHNVPLIEGATVTLDVPSDGRPKTLKYRQ